MENPDRVETPAAEDLRDAILARCDQFETIARSATPGAWFVSDNPHTGGCAVHAPSGNGFRVATTIRPDTGAADAAHVATWDPAAVFALVAGAREIVKVHVAHRGAPTAWCNGCGGINLVEECPTLAALARMLGVAGATDRP